MPLYEYRCKKCDETFELQQSVGEHDRAHPHCPKCEGEDIKPVLGTFFAKTSKKS